MLDRAAAGGEALTHASCAEIAQAMPRLRGALTPDAPLAPLTFFRAGGSARVLFEPADEADLAYFLQNLDPATPVLALGAGSNLILRDGGFAGVVVRLGAPFEEIEIDGTRLRAGAAARDMKLALRAGRAGLAGFSFLRGVPGSIGGALRMNAGAYGAEIRDRLVSCRGVDRAGRVLEFSNADMGYSYRHCGLDPSIIFTRAILEGQPGDPDALAAEMAEITKARSKTQPVSSRTGGSTFKNPPGAKAWELIDAAGCRGLRRGDAQVSELHCNFLVNVGNASAADLEALGEEVRARVKAQSGVTLEWEILRVGER
ncbi:UDP-N-acetylmuramate dehydrogenase [Methylocella sp.]|uniref:UDP-N-acetylmuramate dehydrogenase n=1 Tax=Methylocella sp. TaxID=1978226 RepID=UPI003783D2D1